MSDPRHKYADLRLALEWLEHVKDSVNKLDDLHQGLKESSGYVYGYLKSYCDTIGLENK